eukprot:TRINITY_DN18265_c0_g1_i1.p1 TRINITY_DN18265_c0_g1~~TRINITY_DN18265_c0_g1_i1.p1  ORF type:complete len:731 (+),score=121.68 TRINITY_DN18265_c0_g1_i1:105-2297(+)
MPLVIAKRLPEEFVTLLELIPVPVVLWQLLDRSSFDSMVCLEMTKIAKSFLKFNSDVYGVPHKVLIPMAPEAVREKKMHTASNGSPFNFMIHYSDNKIEAADFEIQSFRVHTDFRIISEFFCAKNVLLTLEGFNTVHFCKSAINFILDQTTTEYTFLSVIIANILGHIENYSKNVTHDKTNNEDFDIMDFNTMIRRLALCDEQNVEYVDIFLRSFPFVGLDSEYILYRLILRYIVAGSDNYFLENEANSHSQSRMVIQLRVINVLKRWMGKYPSYFVKNRNLGRIIESFINYTILVDEGVDSATIKLHNAWRKSLTEGLEEALQQRPTFDQQNFLAPSPNSSRAFSSQRPTSFHNPNYNPNPTSVQSLMSSKNQTPEEFGKTLAKHLTNQVLPIFKSIDLLELHAKLHLKGPTAALECLNVNALIEMSNKISKWVATEICREQDMQHRVELIQVFVEAAYAALSWNDFETCFSISAGLCVHPVDRLSNTWTRLFQRKSPNHNLTIHRIFRRSTKSKLTELETKWLHVRKVVSVAKNYSEYRSKIAEILRAATNHQGIKSGIPAYQVLAKDLMFLDENANKQKSNKRDSLSRIPQLFIPESNYYLSENSSLSVITDDSDLTFETTHDSGSSFDSSSDSGSLDSSREYSCSFENMSQQSLLDAFSDFQKTDSINYFKLNQIATALNYVEHFKNSTYEFATDHAIKTYISQTQVVDEDELYNLSYKINPPNSK